MPVVWDWTQPGPVSPEPSTSGLEHEVAGLAALATLPGACVARVSHLCAQSVTLEPGSNTRRRWRACATQSAVSAALADPNAALPAGARRMTHEEREGDRASACEACGALCAERLTCARVFLRVRMCRARQHNLRGVGETGVHVTRWCLTSLACTISLYLARSRSLLTHVHARTHARTRTRTRVCLPRTYFERNVVSFGISVHVCECECECEYVCVRVRVRVRARACACACACA